MWKVPPWVEGDPGVRRCLPFARVFLALACHQERCAKWTCSGLVFLPILWRDGRTAGGGAGWSPRETVTEGAKRGCLSPSTQSVFATWPHHAPHHAEDRSTDAFITMHKLC